MNGRVSFQHSILINSTDVSPYNSTFFILCSKKKDGTIHERRVDTTRVDNEELVKEIIQGTDFHIDDTAESKI